MNTVSFKLPRWCLKWYWEEIYIIGSTALVVPVHHCFVYLKCLCSSYRSGIFIICSVKPSWISTRPHVLQWWVSALSPRHIPPPPPRALQGQLWVQCWAQSLGSRKLQLVMSAIITITSIIIIISVLCYISMESFNYILNPLVSIKIKKSFYLLQKSGELPFHRGTHDTWYIMQQLKPQVRWIF